MAITLQGWMRYLGGSFFNPERGEQRAGPDRPSTDSGVAMTDSMAMSIGSIFRCVRIIAEVGALMPLKAYERLPNGDARELPPDHWLPTIIRRPNPIMAGDQWLEAMYAQAAGWGNGYSQIVRNSQGIPIEIWPQKVDRMRVVRRTDLMVEYQYPDAMGKLQTLPFDSVFHMKAFTPDGIMGISPLGCARNASGLALQAERYAGSFFAAGGRPAGVLTSDRILTVAQRDQIRAEYGSMTDATTGKRMWLLEGSLKYTPITVNPDDMQMVLTRAFQVAEIARFFGVPLFLLMETEKSTSWGSGIEQQNLALKTYTLQPYTQDMANAWNHWVIPAKLQGKIFVEADMEALQTADFAALSNYYSQGTQNGIITRNEARRKLKLPRSEDPMADQLTAQVNLAPLEQLGSTSAPTRVALQNSYQLGQDILQRIRTQASQP